MPHINYLLVASTLMSLGLLCAQPASAQYRAVDLGVLPGATSSDAWDINSRGEVVGRSGDVAVLWTRDGLIEIGTLPGPGRRSIANGINNRGQAVGWSYTLDATGNSIVTHAFLYADGVLTDLGTLPGQTESFAIDINNRGDIAGESGTFGSPAHVVLWERGAIRDLGEFPRGSGAVLAVNNRQQIVGYSENQVITRGFIWQDGAFTDLPSLPGDNGSFAWDINA